MPAPEYKRCRDCDTEKPLTDFSPTSRGAQGVAAYCRPCMKARRYHRRNPAERRESFRKWVSENADYNRARANRWRRENLDRSAASSQRRRARLAGVWSAEGDSYARLIQGDPCSYCGGPGGTVDHIDPLASGGVHDASNLTAACGSCNSAKKDRPMLLFLATRSG